LKNNTGIDPVLTELDAKLKSTLQEGSLREHLMLWQQQRDINLKLSSTHSIPSINQTKIGQNLTTQSGEDDIHKALAREDAADEVEGDSYAEFGSDEPAPDLLKNETFFRRGELVEVT